VKRRTQLIVKITACAVIVASAVLARLLSEDGVASFSSGQAALFFAFAMASLTLFVLVVFDFDKWVETVPPVPKRVMRGVFRRGARRVGRAAGWLLACYGAGMTWVWSRVGAASGLVVARSAASVARLSSWAARVADAALVRYSAAMHWLWSAVGRALVWTLARVGEGLTTLWAVLARGGLRALVLYRAAMQWLWPPVGHALVWTLSRTGEGLTVLWAAATHGGVRALILYRTGMHWLWSNAGRVIARASVVIGAALTVVGAAIARAGAWSLIHSARGIKRVWLTTVGRGDEPTPKPIRRWYTATVDAAFGIPPDGASVDVFGGRAASHMPTANSRTRAARDSGGDGETVAAGSQSDASQHGA
jgi:hypothetical protein